jgi:D-serine deaminase-like pyridoxal phosphate-dependent protein
MNWYEINNADKIPSPSLLLFPDRIRNNIEKMIAMAGGAERLRPHVKTHKLPQVIALQLGYGIDKFKCATIAEAEMVAESGGKDILLAYPAVGPNIPRLIALMHQYPDVHFATLVDHAHTVKQLSEAASQADVRISLYLDIDCGMHRTGVLPNDDALALYEEIEKLPHLHAEGLHAYDGHIRDSDLVVRTARCEQGMEAVYSLMQKIENRGISRPVLIAGGSPSFPVHARHPDRILSPGTTLLWDYGYHSILPDMDFQHAAVLLTRVVSNPSGLTCFDLGHKAVASEMPHPRVKFMNVEEYEATAHSEEHLVVKLHDGALPVGTTLYAIPYHICPTVALHQQAYVVENHIATEQWEIIARKRKLTV